MSKKLYISKRIKNLGIRLDYYLVENKYEDIKNGVSTYVFGVEVQKIRVDEFNVEFVQKKAIPDLSVSREKALEFLYMISDNDVMPIGLLDVAEEYVDDDFIAGRKQGEKSA